MMTRNRVRLLVLSLGLATAAAPGSAQQPKAPETRTGAPSIQERLNKVASNLFSAAPRTDAAIQELKAILALDPQLAESHLLLGMAYRMAGSADLLGEAKAEFIQALELKPDLVPARSYLAQLYLDLARAGSARETLEAGLVRQPNQPELLALLAEAERESGNPSRAIELSRQALQGNESFAQARYYLGLALLDVGKREEGTKELEQVVRSGPKAVEAYLALGTLYTNAGSLKEAVDVLRQGIAINPSRTDIRIVLARAYRSRGLLASADEQLKLAKPGVEASLASSFAQHRIEPDFYLELGLVRMQQGRLTAAAEAFQKVLDLDPNQESAQRRLAEVRKLLPAAPPRRKPGGKS